MEEGKGGTWGGAKAINMCRKKRKKTPVMLKEGKFEYAGGWVGAERAGIGAAAAHFFQLPSSSRWVQGGFSTRGTSMRGVSWVSSTRFITDRGTTCSAG